LQDVRALLGVQPRKLRFLARFQDQDAVAIEPVGHDLAFISTLILFILTRAAALAQGRKR
jgi:hypothetical protein